jgi:hypothetical protein
MVWKIGLELFAKIDRDSGMGIGSKKVVAVGKQIV